LKDYLNHLSYTGEVTGDDRDAIVILGDGIADAYQNEELRQKIEASLKGVSDGGEMDLKSIAGAMKYHDDQLPEKGSMSEDNQKFVEDYHVLFDIEKPKDTFPGVVLVTPEVEGFNADEVRHNFSEKHRHIEINDDLEI
jgi:hypothetical protein